MPDLSLDPGLDRLEVVAELTFTVRSGASHRQWTWRPASQEVLGTLPDGRVVSFTFGRPTNDEQRRLDAAFSEDHFWVFPQLHARWDARYLHERGPTTFNNRTVVGYQLRYPPDAGGYSPGDVHDLYVADGQLVGWALHPGGQPAATVSARFEHFGPLGPLTVARTRHLADGRVILVQDLDWTPIGLSMSVDVAGLNDFVYISHNTCRIGPLEVARKALDVRGEPPLPPDDVEWDRQLIVRDGPVRTVHRWSSGALRVEHPGWIHPTGMLGCDLWSVDEQTIRAALATVHPADRAALLTFVNEWTLATVAVPGPLRPLAHQVQRAATTCAADGQCESLLAWLRLIR